MANVTVVGAQWGDEGKGKIVDWLSQRADVVVRFQGGHNAGHTLVIDGVTYRLSLLPSGVVRGGKLSIIGSGVVIDPWALLDEIEAVRRQGVEISPANLKIADNATLILPLHRELDAAREDAARDTQALVRETEFSVYMDDLLDWSELRLRPLARGLATEPAVLVLDELSLGLAPLAVEQLYGQVAAMARGVVPGKAKVTSRPSPSDSRPFPAGSPTAPACSNSAPAPPVFIG